MQRLLAIPAVIATVVPLGSPGRAEASPRSKTTNTINATRTATSVTAAYNGRTLSLTAAGVRPKFDDETTDRLAGQICDVPDGDGALNPVNVKVHREFQRTICKEAIRFGISPQLLAIVLQHEGSGRMAALKAAGSGLDELNARHAELVGKGFGRGRSVGIGQMQPENAVELAERYDGQKLDYWEARTRLCMDDRFGIHMTAAFIRRQQEDHGLNDKEAFIAYAYSEDTYGYLRKHHFDDGGQATSRGHRFNELHGEISLLDGYGDRVVTPGVAIE